MNEKEQLYYLVIGLLKETYDVKTFCEEFTRIYDLEIDYGALSELEHECFRELSEKAARFSCCEEELKIPNMFFSESQIMDEVKILKKTLSKQIEVIERHLPQQ